VKSHNKEVSAKDLIDKWGEITGLGVFSPPKSSFKEASKRMKEIEDGKKNPRV
jgi:hypothetical protein